MGTPRARLRRAPLALTLLLVGGFAGPAGAAGIADPVPPLSSWSFGLMANGYAYQDVDSTRTTSDEFRFYQHFAGTASGLAGGGLSFRTAGRFAGLPDDAGPLFETSRLHTGLLEQRLGARARVQVGRQFLQSGVAGLTLDGVRLVYRGQGGLEASAWGGGAVPSGHAFELADFGQDAAAGGRVVFRPARNHRLGLSAAYRERLGVVAFRPVGAEYTTTSMRHLRAMARAAYDLEGGRWVRLEAQGQWRQAGSRPVLTLQYVDRYPTVDAASWFSRFTDLERIRVLRTGLRWESAARFGGEAEYQGAFVGDRASHRIGLAALLPGARVGYALRVGDAGDENSLYGEVGWQARRWLRLEGEASYLTYALLADAPEDQERDLVTLAARARLNLRSGLNVTAEVQALENPRYDSDVRVLLGVDLAMGRGASRFGLDRGGWL